VSWRTILRNIVSNWLGYIVSILVAFFLAPVVVHRLGNTGYGIWTLILSLTGYFGLLDFGIRSTVGRFVARYVSLSDTENVNRTVNTAIAMLACGGLLGLLATVGLSFFLGSFKVEPQLQAAARAALLMAGLNVSLALPLGVFSGVLIALERYDIVSRITIAGTLVQAALVVTLLKTGHGVVALAAIALLINTSQYCAMAIWAKALFPPLKVGRRFVDFGNCKELFGFSIFRFIAIIANQLIFYTDTVVIGAFLGTGAITYYAIAGSLIEYGRHIVSLATDTLYPAATRLDSKDDIPGLRRLLIAGTRISLLLALPLCLGLMFFGKQFITLWMGKAYAVSATYLLVLTIPQFTSMSQYTSALVLAGMARHRMLAYVAFGEGVANLALSIVLVRKIGIVGVAWGTVIPHLLSTAVIIPVYTLRTLRMGAWDYIEQAYLRPVLCAIPVVGLCYGLSHWIERPSWLLFGSEVAAVCGVFGLASYFICLNTGQQASVMESVRRVFHREPVVNEA
jgi:O-antigen/teichoic acid export membrane protein